MDRHPAPSIFANILANLETVIHGKREVLRNFLVAFFAGGHVLLEDVPGTGKTTLAKALAVSVNASFRRCQFTPDLLPQDIIGVTIYNPKSGEFVFRQGPVFTDILLADEINRASPRTQSALLEAMNEWQVSVEGRAQSLGRMFTVIATQNPVEFHGTYPLPEAQLDRFFIRLSLGYPQKDEESLMLSTQQYRHPLEALKPVAELDAIIKARDEVRAVKVGKLIIGYLLDIVELTRKEPRLKLGVSPRGSLALYRTSQALAWAEGRDYVIPDDVKTIASPVLAHRLILETKVRHGGLTKEEVIREMISLIKIPT